LVATTVYTPAASPEAVEVNTPLSVRTGPPENGGLPTYHETLKPLVLPGADTVTCITPFGEVQSLGNSVIAALRLIRIVGVLSCTVAVMGAVTQFFVR